jgi:hypothetical protein
VRNVTKAVRASGLAASFDSLDIMEKVMRHFYLRALIEERMGSQTDWNAVDSLMLKALAAAEKVTRYRHAQLSAVKLAGDINARVADDSSLDDGEDQGGVGEAQADPRADYRLGGCARAAGVENRGRLDRGQSNDRARLAFKGLSPAGCPFPACVAPAEAAGAFRRGGAYPRPGQLAAVGRNSCPAICRRANARARLLARNMLPTALPVCRINLPMRADEAR